MFNSLMNEYETKTLFNENKKLFNKYRWMKNILHIYMSNIKMVKNLKRFYKK